MKPLAKKQKLRAKKKYWGHVVGVQQHFFDQWKLQSATVKEVVEITRLSPATVQRFFNIGAGKKAKPYSWAHGPYASTIFAIADALDLQLGWRKK